MDDRLVRQWVPDELWVVAEPLIPPQRVRPQGGGTAMADPRAVLAAVVFVLRTGCAWRHLPPGFGLSKATAHRRFVAWTRAGLWRRLHRAVLDQLGKLHVLADRTGLPLVVGVSAANTYDSLGLPPLVRAIPAVRSRRGARRRPDKLPADKGYDYPYLRAWLRDRRITPCIARRGIETPTRLGRHRWQVESTIAHLFGYRRLTLRDERHPELFCAFPTLGAALTCYHRLTT